MRTEEGLGAEYARQHRLSVFKEREREKEEMLEDSLPPLQRLSSGRLVRQRVRVEPAERLASTEIMHPVDRCHLKRALRRATQPAGMNWTYAAAYFSGRIRDPNRHHSLRSDGHIPGPRYDRRCIWCRRQKRWNRHDRPRNSCRHKGTSW